MQPRVYRAEGIVLRRIAVGEADRIVTLFTREYGKIEAIAKGSRRLLSRLAGATEPFVHLRALLAVGQNLDVLTQAEVRASFPRLRDDLTRLAYAGYFVELVDASVAERQPQPEIWDLLLAALAVVEVSPLPEAVARGLEVQLLALAGYAPELTVCVLDRVPVGRDVGFHPLRGGVLCPRCARSTPGSLALSTAGLQALRALRTTPLAEAHRLLATPALCRELASCLVPFLRHRFDAPLHSLRFVEAVAGSPPSEAISG